jgi:hypothetical protein
MSGTNVRVVIDVVSVMAAYFDQLFVCTHKQLVKRWRHNTDKINDDRHIGTRHVILAKHWIWLPDDGFM